MLSELQQRRFNGSEGGGGGTAWSPMDDELLAQPQVMKLLDSLREQYTKYQEVCRQRSKRSQLEEIQTKVMQVKHWGGIYNNIKDHFQIAGLCCRKTVFRLPLMLFSCQTFLISLFEPRSKTVLYFIVFPSTFEISLQSAQLSFMSST